MGRGQALQRPLADEALKIAMRGSDKEDLAQHSWGPGQGGAVSGEKMARLNGWQRLGIVLSFAWAVCIGIEAWIELRQGPFGLNLVTETVVTKTGEPVSKVAPEFRDLVPVDQVVTWDRLCIWLLAPLALMWTVGYAVAWVRDGFALHSRT